jgi:hypothetical protein
MTKAVSGAILSPSMFEFPAIIISSYAIFSNNIISLSRFPAEIIWF